MALLHADKVVFYHPWDSLTEYTLGRDFTVELGSNPPALTPSPILGSGLLLVGGSCARSYNNNTPVYRAPSDPLSSMTAAFWVSGLAVDTAEFFVGYGRTSMADRRNGIGIRVTTSGLSVKGEIADSIKVWDTVDVGPITTPAFVVVRAVPSGGNVYASISFNGSAWYSAGSVASTGWSVGSGVGSDSAFVGQFFLTPLGTSIVVDETVLWLDAPEFTATELDNLHQLAATRQRSMDQYTQEFSIHSASGTCDLALTGTSAPPTETATQSAPCTIHGDSPCSGIAPLLIGGFTPKLSSSCPILDPTASIQIGDDLIGIYQARIDALINQLGKNVLLEYDPIVTPCPNCYFDAESKRSTGVYKPTGPTPFPRGQKCPHCKGAGTVEERVTKCIKCLLKWNPSDYASYGVSVVDPKGIVRTKGYLTDSAAISRASSAIVNYDIHATMRLRVRRIRGPVPVGLRQDRYCITFWELIDG
jgi:hypothetical protein